MRNTALRDFDLGLGVLLGDRPVEFIEWLTFTLILLCLSIAGDLQHVQFFFITVVAFIAGYNKDHFIGCLQT